VAACRSRRLAFLLTIILIAIPALLWTAWLCVNNWFNAADGHPMLPALAAIIFAAETWAVSIHQALTRGFTPPVPPALSALLTLGGPPVMAALGVAMLVRLRRSGISIRTLPTPAPGL